MRGIYLNIKFLLRAVPQSSTKYVNCFGSFWPRFIASDSFEMLAHVAIPSSTTYYILHILDWRFNGPFQMPFIMPLNLLATNVSPQCVSGSSPNGGINHLPNRQLHRQQQQQWTGPGKIETTQPLDSQRNALINARDPKNKVWPKMFKDQPTKVTKSAAHVSPRWIPGCLRTVPGSKGDRFTCQKHFSFLIWRDHKNKLNTHWPKQYPLGFGFVRIWIALH